MMKIVYTQPGCKNCDVLKEWLKSKKIKYEERLFDTEAQTEMIMRNMFGDPPFLEVNGEVISSAEMFEMGGKLKASVSLFLDSTEEALK